MTKQGVNVSFADNGLGQVVPGQGPTFIVLGCASTGAANTPFTSTNPNDFPTNFGIGEGPELAAFITNLTGAAVTFSKTTTITNGSNTAVRPGSTNTSTSTVTISGNPLDAGLKQMTVLSGGTIGTGPVQVAFSIDGGASTLVTVNLGTNNTTNALVSTTGETVNFGAGALVTGDTFTWVSTAPLWNDAGVQSALDSTRGVTGVTFQNVFVAGVAGGSDATAFDGYMTTRQSRDKRFGRLLCGTRDAVWGGASTETEAAWMASIEADFANVSSLTVGACAGHYRQLSPITKAQMRRNLLWSAAARNAGVDIQIDLGEVDLGGLPNLILPAQPDSFAGGTFFYHDEAINPGLDAARFLSAWRITGLPGLYIVNPNLLAPPGSDFNWLQHGQVADAAATLLYAYYVKLLSKGVRVSAKTGFILPQDASRIEGGGNALLKSFLTDPGRVSSAVNVVSRTDNILSTATLTVTCEIVPLGYLKAINLTIAFLNPALIVQQAA